MHTQVLFTILGMAVASPLDLLFKRAPLSPGECTSLEKNMFTSSQQAQATRYCSSLLSVSDVSTTTTVPSTSTSVTLATVYTSTVTSTTYTLTKTETTKVTAATSTFTTLMTVTGTDTWTITSYTASTTCNSAPENDYCAGPFNGPDCRDYKRDLSDNPAPVEKRAEAKPGVYKDYTNDRQLSSACSCLSLAPTAKWTRTSGTVTTTLTKTISLQSTKTTSKVSVFTTTSIQGYVATQTLTYTYTPTTHVNAVHTVIPKFFKIQLQLNDQPKWPLPDVQGRFAIISTASSAPQQLQFDAWHASQGQTFQFRSNNNGSLYFAEAGAGNDVRQLYLDPTSRVKRTQMLVQDSNISCRVLNEELGYDTRGMCHLKCGALTSWVVGEDRGGDSGIDKTWMMAVDGDDTFSMEDASPRAAYVDRIVPIIVPA